MNTFHFKNELREIRRDSRFVVTVLAVLPLAWWLVQANIAGSHLGLIYKAASPVLGVAQVLLAFSFAFHLFRPIDVGNPNSPWRLWPVATVNWAGARILAAVAMGVVWPALVHAAALSEWPALFVAAQWYAVWGGIFLACRESSENRAVSHATKAGLLIAVVGPLLTMVVGVLIHALWTGSIPFEKVLSGEVGALRVIRWAVPAALALILPFWCWRAIARAPLSRRLRFDEALVYTTLFTAGCLWLAAMFPSSLGKDSGPVGVTVTTRK